MNKNKVTQAITVLKPNGREAVVETFKDSGMYYLQVSHVNAITGLKEDYKSQSFNSKEFMFKYRNLAIDYLKDKGIW